MEDVGESSRPGIGALFKRFLLLPTLAAVSLGLLVAGFWLVSDSPNFRGHAAGHWIMAIPVLFVGLTLVRVPEARTTPRRIARLFVTVVVLALAASQLLEGIGAFASGNGGVATVLESMHGLGEAGTLFSVFALPLSFVIVAVVYTLAAMHALMGRRSSRKSA